MPLKVICIILIGWTFLASLKRAYAQVASASFDVSTIGESPAAAATREFGVLSPFVSYTHIGQDIDEDINGSVRKWKRNIKIQRFEAVAAGKKAFFVPELYLSQNNGTKRLKVSSSEQENKQDIDMLNNQANLAMNISKNFKFGVKIFAPSISGKWSETYNFSDGTKRSYDSDSKNTILGLGGGAIYKFFDSLYVGVYYNGIEEKRKSTFTSKEGNNPASTDNTNETNNHQQIGYGIAVERGNVKSAGFRMEMSYSTMKFGGQNRPKGENVQTRFSIEGTSYGFTGGITGTQTSGAYINYRYFMDQVMSDVNYGSVPVFAYGGFFGFKTKSGGTFSGSASYSSGKSDVDLFGIQQPGKVTKMNLGLSYAYYF